MKKRLLAFLTALAFLFCGLTAFADEPGDEEFSGYDDYEDEWDDDEYYDDEEFYDDEEMEFDEDEEQEEIDNTKSKMNSLSGYLGDYQEDGDFTYIAMEDGKTCATDRYLGIETEVTVPETLGGLTVTAIGEMTFKDCKVRKVTLPETIESIDRMAFFKCEMLEEIEIPEGVTTIGFSCFGGCLELEKVTVPESLELVDEFAFLSCSSLEEIVFGKNLKKLGPNCFNRCEMLMRVVLPKETEVDETAFTMCPEDMETEYCS